MAMRRSQTNNAYLKMKLDLHPYDNIERRYRDTDVSQEAGLEVIKTLLHLGAAPSPEGLFYDLMFFSGGIGVLDELAISMPASTELWAGIAAGLRAQSPEKAIEEESWAEELMWLLTGEDGPAAPRAAAIRFINSERRPFQAECHSASRILFQADSNVNDWTVLWGNDAQLNYLGYSQG
jgi:hypothetical protein